MGNFKRQRTLWSGTSAGRESLNVSSDRTSKGNLNCIHPKALMFPPKRNCAVVARRSGVFKLLRWSNRPSDTFAHFSLKALTFTLIGVQPASFSKPSSALTSSVRLTHSYLPQSGLQDASLCSTCLQWAPPIHASYILALSSSRCSDLINVTFLRSERHRSIFALRDKL